MDARKARNITIGQVRARQQTEEQMEVLRILLKLNRIHYIRLKKKTNDYPINIV